MSGLTNLIKNEILFLTDERNSEREVITYPKKRIPIHCEECVVKLCLTEAENESEFCGYSLLGDI